MVRRGIEGFYGFSPLFTGVDQLEMIYRLLKKE